MSDKIKTFRMEITCKKCKRTTDATYIPIHKVNVKCGHCNGYLITPNGNFDGKIVYLKKVFSIASENVVSFIIADDIETALNFFENLHNEKPNQHNQIKQKYYNEITLTNVIVNEEGNKEEVVCDLSDLILVCDTEVQEITHMSMDEYSQRYFPNNSKDL